MTEEMFEKVNAYLLEIFNKPFGYLDKINYSSIGYVVFTCNDFKVYDSGNLIFQSNSFIETSLFLETLIY